MSNNIQKTTYVEADYTTTKALTYDMLENLRSSIEELIKIHTSHIVVCDAKFEKLNNRKKIDTTLSTLSGFVGGAMVAVAAFFKDLFSKN